jgi:hypothetical protein
MLGQSRRYRRRGRAADTGNRSKGPIFPPRVIARFEHEHAILAAFARLEASRNEMHEAALELQELIKRDPEQEWQQRWDDFLSAGGVTMRELCAWMVHGRQIRRSTKRQHLRLVSDAPKQVPHSLAENGPEAA